MPVRFCPVLPPAVVADEEARLLAPAPGEAAELPVQAAIAAAGGGVWQAAAPWLRVAPGAVSLVLAGKGHNAADALVAASPGPAEVWVVLAQPPAELRPATAAALAALGERARLCRWPEVPPAAVLARVTVVFDGLLGFGLKPPVAGAFTQILNWVNALGLPEAAWRVAVDVPSGLHPQWREGDPLFRADLTVATGCPKAPVTSPTLVPWVGRLRWVDLGWAWSPAAVAAAQGAEVFHWAGAPGPRGATLDKRHFGHALVVAGSRAMPGAALLAVRAALRGGVGLVTALVPASVQPALAAAAPEAMWVPWPESRDGELSVDHLPLVWRRLERVTAVLVGPGLGREMETRLLIERLTREVPLPLVLDADALLAETPGWLLRRPAKAGPVVLTPHEGERQRLGAPPEVPALAQWAARHRAVVVAKGPRTVVAGGPDARQATSLHGGPALARGGSGDLLAGLLVARLAQPGVHPWTAAVEAVALHGVAADRLAHARGEHFVATGDLLDFLPT